MRIRMRNLPKRTNTNEVIVGFHVNVSLSGIEHGSVESDLIVLIPSSISVQTVTIVVFLIDLGLALELENSFSYILPPTPAIARIVPTQASVQRGSLIRVSVTNFPKVSAPEDVQVKFQSGGLTSIATVHSVYMNSEQGSIQNLQIDVQSPVGIGVKPGFAVVLVFHKATGQTQPATLRDSFMFVDSFSPQVSRMSSLDKMGINQLPVPMTQSTQISVDIANVPRPADVEPSSYFVQIGNIPVNIDSAMVTDDGQARLFFFSIPSIRSGDEYGIVSFGTLCSSDCCADMSCPSTCPDFKSACFVIQYYDDTVPQVNAKTDLRGPSVGGDEIRLVIENFPTLASAEDVLVSYQVSNERTIVENVVLVYSSAPKTEILIVTPFFSTITTETAIQFTIEPIEDPRKNVNVLYIVEAVQASVATFFPSAGSYLGGTTVLVELDFFVYPTDLLIRFNSQDQDHEVVPDEYITILPVSSRTRTAITFVTPSTLPGRFHVMILPKYCSYPCAMSASFSFSQIDDTLPELVAPVPFSGSFHSMNMPPINLRQAPAQDAVMYLNVSFEGHGQKFQTSSFDNIKYVHSETTGVSTLSIPTPQISEQGSYKVTLKFELLDGTVQEVRSFDFIFFDGFAPRIVSTTPNKVPTSAVVEGRQLYLHSEISIVCANFPQDIMGKNDVAVALNSSAQIVTLIDVRHLVSCEMKRPDCNRSLIVVKLPSLESPGVDQLVISRMMPGRETTHILSTPIEYAPPCDYFRFCQAMGLVTNFPLLETNPVVECDANYCLDPNRIGDPVVVDAFPTEGSVSGGTFVTVVLRDFPAFSPSDASVQIQGSNSVQIAPILALNQSKDSTLLSSLVTILFQTPVFTSRDTIASVSISVPIAGTQKAASFPFEYLPAISGPPRVVRYLPTTAYAGEELNILVELENIRRLEFPFSSRDLLVHIFNTEMSSGSITVVYSDRYTTSLRISATLDNAVIQDFGAVTIGVGSRLEVWRGMGTFNITILETPSPVLISSYPTQYYGISPSEQNLLSVLVAHLPPFAIDTISMMARTEMQTTGSTYTVQVMSAVSLTAERCFKAYCSLTEIRLKVPALADADQQVGGAASIQVYTGAQTLISFYFYFRAASAPKVLMVEPSLLSLKGQVPVTVYLQNYPSAVCKLRDPPDCSQEAINSGMRVMFERLANPLTFEVLDINGLMAVTFLAPPSQVAGAEVGTIGLCLQSLACSSSVEFLLKYKMPQAEITPKDGTMRGGDLLSISSQGWWGNGEVPASLPTSDSLIIKFGDTTVLESDIVSVMSEDTSLVTVIRSPASSLTGAVACSISGIVNGETKTSRFLFDFFNNPTVANLQPRKASIFGRTTNSEDDRSVVMTVKDFPFVSSPQDLRVTFGHHVCGSSSMCAVTQISYLQEKGTMLMLVRIAVPPASTAGEVSISVEQASVEAGRKARRAETRFSYYTPRPDIQSVRWCKTCVQGAGPCIIMGVCGDGHRPRDDSLPIHGGGTVTIIVDHPPSHLISSDVGGSPESAVFSLFLGSAYGIFVKIAWSNVEWNGENTFMSRLALEFEVPDSFSGRDAKLTISMHSLKGLSAASAFRGVSFFDDRVALACLRGCEQSAQGNQDVIVSVSNLPLAFDSPVVDQVIAKIGVRHALSVHFEHDYPGCNQTATCLRMVSPGCIDCTFSGGVLELPLTLALKADRLGSATTCIFKYFSPPNIVAARLDAAGVSIRLQFDQDTDKGKQAITDTNCDHILDHETMDKLAAHLHEASCVWENNQVFIVFLGPGATIVPGDAIRIRRDILRSRNAVSGPSTSTATVEVPQFAAFPVLSLTVQGPQVVDACSDLEIRATGSSARALDFSWSCRNDEILDEALSTVSSATLFLESGTHEMQVFDKEYDIVVTATNFLGVSEQVGFSVLKRGFPTPLLTFDPPSFSTTRDQDVLISVQASFSQCPTPRNRLKFLWRLDRTEHCNSQVDISIFESTTSQLYIPADLLNSGCRYVLVVEVYMENERGSRSESIYTLDVVSRPLVAKIAGGTEILASKARELVLDASASMDPDFNGDVDADLQFAWSCSVTESVTDLTSPLSRGVSNVCLDMNGVDIVRYLTSSGQHNQSRVVLRTHVLQKLAASDKPYLFEVRVAKGSRTPSTFQMPVVLVDKAIPSAAIQMETGWFTEHGGLKINPNQQLVLTGHCSLTAPTYSDQQGTALKWNFDPPVAKWTTIKEDNVANATHLRETIVLEENAQALVAGTTYEVELECVELPGSTAKSVMRLSVNAPPVGPSCRACRLAGGQCATENPLMGQPITDIFRYSCLNWADHDVPLEYQFAYSVLSGGNYFDMVFDWAVSPVRDLVLPSGTISLKARVRDSYGAATQWMQGDTLFVGADAGSRRLLGPSEEWPAVWTRVQETLDLADFSLVNQLVGALAIQVNEWAQKNMDDRSSATRRKEILFETLRVASDQAVKTEGFACETLSVSEALGSNIYHISAASVSHLSSIVLLLSSSGVVRSLAPDCAKRVLTLTRIALTATHENRTCLPNGFAGTAQDELMRPFLTNMDDSLDMVLQKASSRLVTGQKRELKDLAWRGFNYEIARIAMSSNAVSASRLSKGVDLPAVKYSGVTYRLPQEILQGPGVISESSLSVLFGAFQYPPVIGGVNPISPVVTLALADATGHRLEVSNLRQTVNITIPISLRSLCNVERALFTGRSRCLHWDKEQGVYSPDGCAVLQNSDTEVTCMCTHLTSFVVEPVIEEPICTPCDQGFYQSKACTQTSHRVCQACPAGKYANGTGSTSSAVCIDCSMGKFADTSANFRESHCTSCSAGKFSSSLGASTAQTCSECIPGKVSSVSSSSCTACGAGSYSDSMKTMCVRCAAGKVAASIGNTDESDCVPCIAGRYSSENRTSCVACGAGKYLDSAGNDDEADCFPCAEGKFSNQTGASTVETCQDCAPGKYSETTASTTCDSCSAGKYSTQFGAISAAFCAECPAGSFALAEASAACTNCLAGKYSNVTASSACTECREGTFLDEVGSDDESDCRKCVKGKYSVSIGATNDSVCQDCPSGKYGLHDGAREASACNECDAGKYLEGFGASSASACSLCKAGKYSNMTGASHASACVPCMSHSNSTPGSVSPQSCECIPGFTGPISGACAYCPVGTYKDSFGSGACTQCVQNSTSMPGSTTADACKCNIGFTPNQGSCSQCPIGTWYGDGHCLACGPCELGFFREGCLGLSQGSCKACPRGTYADNVTLFVCKSCPVGKSTNRTMAKSRQDCGCDRGYASSPDQNAGGCAPCVAGKYKDQYGNEECSACPGNSTSEEGSLSLDACLCKPGYAPQNAGRCVSCPAGKYKDKNAGLCLACTSGKYSAAVSASTASSCENCIAGKYAASEAATACTECSAGKYSMQSMSRSESDCELCGKGKYSPAVGASAASQCWACGAGKYSDSFGATTQAVCTLCDAGKFASSDVNDNEADCIPCRAGTFSGLLGASTCQACEAGKYLPTRGRNSSIHCVPCVKGKYSTASGAFTSAACRDCGAGNYSTVLGADSRTACLPCASGKYASSPVNDAEDDCQACNAGTFSSVGSPSCITCPAFSVMQQGGTRGSDCVCVEGYKHRITASPDDIVNCTKYAAFTAAKIVDSSVAPGARNFITVRFMVNLNIPAGTVVVLSGLIKTSSPSSQIAIVSTKGDVTGLWRYDEGSLRFSLGQPALPEEEIVFSFDVQNPYDAQEAPEIRLGLMFISGLKIELLLSASTAMTVCRSGYYGAGCGIRCYGDVVGRKCVCRDGQFGVNCGQTGVLLPSSVGPTMVQLGAAADLKSASGVGISIPAGALTSSETLEVKVYNVKVEIGEQQAETIVPVGPLAVFTPHGLEFAIPVSLFLSYDPSQVPQGQAPYVHYYNETAAPPRWQRMGGTIAGPGLLETKTTHFSTFGVMATAESGSMPSPAPGVSPTGTPPPVQVTPPET